MTNRIDTSTMNSTTNSITVEAPAKLLLLGEYLALFGYPALGLALPLTMKMKYTPANTALDIQSEVSVSNDFYDYLHHICEKNALPILKGTIIIESDIPIASGLGSSSAFCVCIAKILYTLHKQTDDVYKIWRLAHTLECFFHKQASGIDTAIVSLGGSFGVPLLLEQKNHTENPSGYEVYPIDISLQGNIVYGYTQRIQHNAQSIPQVFSHIKEKMNHNAISMKEWIDAHTSAVNTVKNFNAGAISKDMFLGEFALYVNKIHSALITLGISTEKIDTALSLMKERGCLGGKISGGGYGGAFYCIMREEGLEPSHLSALDPKSSVSTNFTILAIF